MNRLLIVHSLRGTWSRLRPLLTRDRLARAAGLACRLAGRVGTPGAVDVASPAAAEPRRPAEEGRPCR